MKSFIYVFIAFLCKTARYVIDKNFECEILRVYIYPKWFSVRISLIQVFSNLCFSLYPKAVKLEAMYSITSVLGIKMTLKIKQGAAMQ